MNSVFPGCLPHTLHSTVPCALIIFLSMAYSIPPIIIIDLTLTVLSLGSTPSFIKFLFLTPLGLVPYRPQAKASTIVDLPAPLSPLIAVIPVSAGSNKRCSCALMFFNSIDFNVKLIINPPIQRLITYIYYTKTN